MRFELPPARSGGPTYVESVLLAAEVLDSRYAGYRFRLPDVVALPGADAVALRAAFDSG